MKSNQESRNKIGSFDTEVTKKKPVKLEPIKKSGKDRRHILDELNDDDDVELNLHRKESILDYFDDEEEDL